MKKGDWTKGEDTIILTTQSLFGNQWAQITKLLNGRTDGAVKNRFHVLQRNMLKDDESYETSTTSSISSVGCGHKTKRPYTDDYNSNPTKIRRTNWNSIPTTTLSSYSSETDYISEIDSCSEIDCYSEISGNFDSVEQEILDLLASDICD